MIKNNLKTSQDEKRSVNDKIIKILKDNTHVFDLGNGIDFSIRSHSSLNSEERKTTIAFSSNLPKLTYKTNGIRREASVEFSSTEGENTALLHYLFKKTAL